MSESRRLIAGYGFSYQSHHDLLGLQIDEAVLGDWGVTSDAVSNAATEDALDACRAMRTDVGPRWTADEMKVRELRQREWEARQATARREIAAIDSRWEAMLARHEAQRIEDALLDESP